MGVGIFNSTISGGYTPVCNSCGVHLCWDISEEEYEQRKKFLDDWKCKECTED